MRKKEENAITLIALVITIIILLILAGVTISSLSGENGIINKAIQAKEESKKAEFNEKLEIATIKIKEVKRGENQKEEIKKILEKDFEEVIIGDGFITIKDKENKASIDSKGNKLELVEENQKYTGCYIDFEGKNGMPDGIPDGIIFADLAIGSDGIKTWRENTGDIYEIPKLNLNYKKYYISNEKYNDARFDDEKKIGKKINRKVISPIKGTVGEDRFYIMSLEDTVKEEYTWYRNARDKMLDYKSRTSKKFGSGRQNTKNIYELIGNNGKGTYNDGKTIKQVDYGSIYYDDFWNLQEVQKKVEYDINQKKAKAKWFVPSEEEWIAFGAALNIDKENYKKHNLQNWYHTSSQRSSSTVSDLDFNMQRSNTIGLNYLRFVRLATTF